jgi:hypothetical protein
VILHAATELAVADLLAPSRNVRDFQRTGVEVIDPWEPT